MTSRVQISKEKCEKIELHCENSVGGEIESSSSLGGICVVAQFGNCVSLDVDKKDEADVIAEKKRNNQDVNRLQSGKCSGIRFCGFLAFLDFRICSILEFNFTDLERTIKITRVSSLARIYKALLTS